MVVRVRARPWARRWMVVVSAWVLIFPLALIDYLIDAVRWAAADVQEAVDSVEFTDSTKEDQG